MFAEQNVQNRVGWVKQRETHAGIPADVPGAWVSRCSTHPTFYVLCKYSPVQLGRLVAGVAIRFAVQLKVSFIERIIRKRLHGV